MWSKCSYKGCKKERKENSKIVDTACHVLWLCSGEKRQPGRHLEQRRVTATRHSPTTDNMMRD